MASITGKNIILYPDKHYVVFRSTSAGPLIATPILDEKGKPTGEYTYTSISSSGVVFQESTCFYIPKGWMYSGTAGSSQCPLQKGQVVCVAAQKGPSFGMICCWNPHVTGYTVSGCGQSHQVSLGGSTTICCDVECPSGHTLRAYANGGVCGTIVKRTSATFFSV